MSQETLAELSDLHWSFIGQIERGKRNITLHNIVKVAHGLNVDPSELVRGISIDQLPEKADTETPAETILRERRLLAGEDEADGD